MNRILWFIGVPTAAFVAGAAGFLPIYVMGLSVPMFLVMPLALLTGCLLATLSAGWAANLSATGASAHTKSRLQAIFVASLGAALVSLLVGFAGSFIVNRLGVGMRFNADLVVGYLPSAIVFAGVIAVAAWRFRTPATDRLGLAGRIALVLAATWVLLLVLVNSGYLFLSDFPGFGAGSEIIVLLGGSVVLTALGAFLAARFSQGAPRRGLQWDAALSLVTVGVMPAIIIGAISLGCSITSCVP